MINHKELTTGEAEAYRQGVIDGMALANVPLSPAQAKLLEDMNLVQAETSL